LLPPLVVTVQLVRQGTDRVVSFDIVAPGPAHLAGRPPVVQQPADAFRDGDGIVGHEAVTALFEAQVANRRRGGDHRGGAGHGLEDLVLNADCVAERGDRHGGAGDQTSELGDVARDLDADAAAAEQRRRRPGARDQQPGLGMSRPDERPDLVAEPSGGDAVRMKAHLSGEDHGVRRSLQPRPEANEVDRVVKDVDRRTR